MDILQAKIHSLKIGKKEILKQIYFSLQKGDILCILGKNGSGKSTLLKSLLGLLSFNGEILFKNKNLKNFSLKQKSKFLAYVPQNTNIPFDFNLFEVVLMGRFSKSPFFAYSKQDRQKNL